MHIISKIALITINETLFVQLISFLIFLFIINRLMFRPLRETMLERDMYISATKHDIVDAEKEIEKITDQLTKQESKIRAEANEIKEKIEIAGNQDADKIFASVREEIASLKDKKQKEIDAVVAQVKKDFDKESEKLALIIMEKVLNRRVPNE